MVPIEYFISNTRMFADCKDRIERCCRTKANLPMQVFQEGVTFFGFEEFDWTMSSEFWTTVQSLCIGSGDESCLIAVLDPHPIDYFHKEFGYFNWAVLPVSASSEKYWDLLNRHPVESPADSIVSNSEKVIWLPASGKWAIWGERSFGMCVLGCHESVERCAWHDVDWALKYALPNCFRGRTVPQEFADCLRLNYSGTSHANHNTRDGAGDKR